jgi:cytochrome c-type biogenesis protein CcmH/NrfF
VIVGHKSLGAGLKAPKSLLGSNPVAIPASRGARRLGELLDAPIALVVVLTLAATMSLVPLGAAASSAAADPRPSLPAIERQVMCVTCKIPLAVAQSPQANRERAFIQGLIDQGEDEAQIKRTLVGQYGPAVLALPSAHGFDLAAYLVPLAAVLALLAALAVLLPHWRRQASGPDGPDTPPQALSPRDAARLDADLTRFD